MERLDEMREWERKITRVKYSISTRHQTSQGKNKTKSKIIKKKQWLVIYLGLQWME